MRFIRQHTSKGNVWITDIWSTKHCSLCSWLYPSLQLSTLLRDRRPVTCWVCVYSRLVVVTSPKTDGPPWLCIPPPPLYAVHALTFPSLHSPLRLSSKFRTGKPDTTTHVTWLSTSVLIQVRPHKKGNWKILSKYYVSSLLCVYILTLTSPSQPCPHES